ncbi:DUF998 domain-containing protein [Actinocorallia populi]|uniref:DUF998 domain-containing protein n=1 Tax=Actinocorallia populi TaxID=2079200 RepID=UPI000D08A0A8|nr:DUF998 domain-containing protein [Actinocorallia populi]
MTTITLQHTASAPARTRTALTLLAAASPLWAAVSLAQALTRDGYDLTRHPLSVLSTGSLGWLQIANFLFCGVLTAVGAIGLRRALHGTPGGTWAPRLVAVYGLGMIAAGVFVMDPADGFPVGTPAGAPTTVSWHALLHLASGSIAFIALAAACFVLARRYARAGDRARAVLSRLAGTAVALGNLWAMSNSPAASLVLAVGVITGMLWISAVAARLRGTAL